MSCEFDINMTLHSDEATVKIFNVERKLFVDLVTEKPLKIASIMPFALAYGTKLCCVVDLILLQQVTILVSIDSQPMLELVERNYGKFTPKNATKALGVVKKVFAVMIEQRIHQKRNSAHRTNA